MHGRATFPEEGKTEFQMMLKRERKRTDRHPAILAFILMGAFACSTANAQSKYSVTDLGNGVPRGINSRGDVVGDYYNASDTNFYAFLYTNGKRRNLGALVAGGDSIAFAVNDRDEAVGVSYTHPASNAFIGNAFLYQNGKLLDLTPGNPASVATGINQIGQVTGFYDVGATHAFLYSNGQIKDLGTLPTGNSSEAYSINNRGQVAGYSSVNGGLAFHAFVYSSGRMQDIGAFGPKSAMNSAIAFCINDHGQVVGEAGLPGGVYHAFLYTGGPLRDLGTYPGHPNTDATGINNSGVIVGGTDVAFVYVAGHMYDLNTLLVPNSGWLLTAVGGINDSGQIAATGYPVGSGVTHALLLTPVMRH
jgi:probable HAF family extracellular repeat protein